jgi:hypothetical protein
MDSKLPRRTFLMAWLGGLLAGWLGRSQAQAAPTPSVSPPVLPLTPAGAEQDSASGATVTLTASATPHSGEAAFEWKVASLPDTEPFSYSASGLPPGMSIDPSTGLIHGTISWTSH